MSKQAADRYTSAAEAAELFEACLAHVQQPTTVPLPEYCLLLRESRTSFASRTATHFQRWPLFRTLTAVGFAGLLVLAGILILLELNNGRLTIQSEADDAPALKTTSPPETTDLAAEPVWGKPVDGLQLAVSGIRQVRHFKSGDSIRFCLSVRNVGTQAKFSTEPT